MESALFLAVLLAGLFAWPISLLTIKIKSRATSALRGTFIAQIIINACWFLLTLALKNETPDFAITNQILLAVVLLADIVLLILNIVLLSIAYLINKHEQTATA